MAPDDGIHRPDPHRDKAGGGKGLPAPTRVELERTDRPATPDELLWEVIKDRSVAVSFEPYAEFMDAIAVDAGDLGGVNAYEIVKVATELFLRQEAGLWLNPGKDPEQDIRIITLRAGPVAERVAELLRDIETVEEDEENVSELRDRYLADLSEGVRVLPYHKMILNRLSDLPLKPHIVTDAYGINEAVYLRPLLLELIWSYWHEEGMLMQTINAVSRRFQNRAGDYQPDPLARLEIDPLRGVNSLLWGWIQDEIHRLTVQRRAYEYDHHYGITLWGKAVPPVQPVDSRSQFLRAFHDLLAACARFYEGDDDTTVVADAFPVLNALKDTHVILAEGAHNQYGDLPWTARVEMMMVQWMVARPEFREFLGGRTMVPYRERWMDRVDTMKQIQGWSDTSVSYFRDLAVFGERLLLSIRFGDWSEVDDQLRAANWVRWWRPEVQQYLHAYRAVTGVDLTGTQVEPLEVASSARYVQPSVHLRNKLAERQSRGRLPAGTPSPTARPALAPGSARALSPGRNAQGSR